MNCMLYIEYCLNATEVVFVTASCIFEHIRDIELRIILTAVCYCLHFDFYSCRFENFWYSILNRKKVDSRDIAHSLGLFVYKKGNNRIQQLYQCEWYIFRFV